jgi:hypothetical protein
MAARRGRVIAIKARPRRREVAAPLTHEGELVASPLGESFALTDLDTTVVDQLVAAYPEGKDGSGTKRFDIGRRNGSVHSRVKATKVFLSNQLSLYIFQAGPDLYLEIKGLSGGRMIGAEPLADRTERFPSSAALMTRIAELAQLRPREFAVPRGRPFRSRDSVAVVLSESTYRALKDPVDRYVAHLRIREERAATTVIPVPDAIVAERNPARVRDALRRLAPATEGLMLVGPDIKPFELVSTQGAAFHFASTDLPYGAFDSPFWDQPVRKSDARYAEKAYHSSPNRVFQMTQPTPFTFDIDAFARGHLARSRAPYAQTYWVTRWVGTDPSPQGLLRQFGAFVTARLQYAPPERHNVLGLAGGTGPLYDPGPDTVMQSTFERSHDALMANAPAGSTLQTVYEADLQGAIVRVDANVTLLNLSEHGTPEAVGEVKAWNLRRISRLPPLVHLEACSNGMWGYTKLEESIVANLLGLAQPPITIVACQTEKGFPTMGGPDGVTKAENVLMDGWKPGQTLGRRQVDSTNGHLRSWDAGSAVAGRPFPGEAFLQLFATASIFGDGTVEL